MKYRQAPARGGGARQVRYPAGLTIAQDGVRRSGLELLGRPDIGLSGLRRLWPELGDVSPAIAEQLEIDGRYAGYLDRQEADILAFRRDEALELPAGRRQALPGIPPRGRR